MSFLQDSKQAESRERSTNSTSSPVSVTLGSSVNAKTITAELVPQQLTPIQIVAMPVNAATNVDTAQPIILTAETLNCSDGGKNGDNSA